MMALDAMNISLTEVDVNMDKAEHRESELTTVRRKDNRHTNMKFLYTFSLQLCLLVV